MAYLISSDLKRFIQTDNLQAIIGGDSSILTAAQQSAQEECITFLSQKYDVSQEFTDSNIWSYTAVYKASNRIYLDALPYDSAAAYALHDLTLQAGKVYINTSAISAPGETFNASHWTLLGSQYDIFYAKYPQPLFDVQSVYAKNAPVFWKDYTFIALTATPTPDHDALLQYGNTQNVPFSNYFPDDPVNGSRQWTNAVAYLVAAGTLPTNINFWIKGDNRSQNIVMYIIDIALYHLHSRIAPRNIPDLRIKRYDDAITHLKGYAKGTTTANLAKLQPPQGKRIRWGSQIKRNNSF